MSVLFKSDGLKELAGGLREVISKVLGRFAAGGGTESSVIMLKECN